MNPPTKVGRRLLTVTRVLFGLIFVAAVVLGYLGIAAFVGHLPADAAGRGFWDVAYYDAQLFVLGSSPLDRAGPYPIALDVARFLAPAATLYAVFEATRALFARQLRQWWVRSMLRGHIIVTGDSSIADALADRFRLSTPRSRVLRLDRADPESLRDVGIGGAAALYACADDAGDSSVNVLAAFAAVAAKRRRWRSRRLSVYAQVSDPTLALALRARRIGLPHSKREDVDFFNVEELAARALLDLDAVTVPAGHPPHILVAGASTFGRALIVEYTYFRLLNSPPHSQRAVVTLVDPDAEAIVRDLTARWDILSQVVELKAGPGDLAAAYAQAPGWTPHRAYICYDDEDLALRQALTVAPLWSGGSKSLIVRLSRLHGHGKAFGQLLDGFGGRLRIEGATRLAADRGVIERSLVERLAEAIHDQYIVDQVLADPPTTAALTQWRDLTKDLLEANRAQARDIGVKLEMLGCTVAPRIGPPEPMAFTDAEIEPVAIHEHDRWLEERRSRGWRYGPVRIDKDRIHPSMVAWDRLSDKEQDKDRDVVRALPKVLAHVGLRIVRLPRPIVPGQPSPQGERVPSTM